MLDFRSAAEAPRVQDYMHSPRATSSNDVFRDSSSGAHLSPRDAMEQVQRQHQQHDVPLTSPRVSGKPSKPLPTPPLSQAPVAENESATLGVDLK